MKIYKLLVLLLCAAFIFTVIAGCDDTADDAQNLVEGVDDEQPAVNGDENPSDDLGDNPGFDTYPNIDITAAMNAFAPDTAMITAGDSTITWAELFFYLHDAVATLSNGFTVEIDWSEEYSPEYMPGETIADVALQYASEQVRELLLYASLAKAIDVSFSQEALDAINDDINSRIDSSGSLENLELELRSNGFYDLDTFESLLKLHYMQGELLNSLYGDNLSNVSDEDVIKYADAQELMQAKHILRSFLSEADGHTPEEVEDSKIAALETIEGIFKDLDAQKDDEDFADIFAAMVSEHSEDPGSLSYPDGYLFQHGDMVVPFSDACAALDYGEMSGIVETNYGYHIILRLPVNFESVPVSISNSGYNYTLRQAAAFNDFDNLLQQQHDIMNVVFSPEYESINLADLFVFS